VLANSLGEENFLRDERHIEPELRASGKIFAIFSRLEKLTSTLGDVNVFQRCNRLFAFNFCVAEQ
jgi:hypothetical protein